MVGLRGSLPGSPLLLNSSPGCCVGFSCQNRLGVFVADICKVMIWNPERCQYGGRSISSAPNVDARWLRHGTAQRGDPDPPRPETWIAAAQASIPRIGGRELAQKRCTTEESGWFNASLHESRFEITPYCHRGGKNQFSNAELARDWAARNVRREEANTESTSEVGRQEQTAAGP